MKKQKKAFSFSSLLPKHPDDAPIVPFPGFLARVSPERRGRAPPPSSSSDPPTSLPPQVELAAVAAGREPGALRGEPHAVDAAGVPGAAASARGAGVADRGGALVGPTEAPELCVCFLLLSLLLLLLLSVVVEVGREREEEVREGRVGKLLLVFFFFFRIKAFASFDKSIRNEKKASHSCSFLGGIARLFAIFERRSIADNVGARQRETESWRSRQEEGKERQKRDDADSGDVEKAIGRNPFVSSPTIHLDVLVPSARRQQARRVKVEREHGLLRVPDDLERLGLHRELFYSLLSFFMGRKKSEEGSRGDRGKKNSTHKAIVSFVRRLLPSLSLSFSRVRSFSFLRAFAREKAALQQRWASTTCEVRAVEVAAAAGEKKASSS